jgi:hypothetical protein
MGNEMKYTSSKRESTDRNMASERQLQNLLSTKLP